MSDARADLNRKHEDFIRRLNALKTEAGKLGFYRTMHALDEATQQIGWEVASHRDPSQRKLGDRYMKERQ